MALGIGGTGPYGQIRALRTEISNYKYELSLISQGHRRPVGKKKLAEMISANQVRIKKILNREKQKKKTKTT